ncbi:unnamed protein product [Adineta ricciae]|uniref:Uncharacterized protein n=1 Tax=Adineta ricciae TaxID=249248 RepID=A0A813YAN3_ADIRI|nr:unnamed protein product [Adineta ricciae]CAF1401993.1 unnamed protein product [Adineta ricciae]
MTNHNTFTSAHSSENVNGSLTDVTHESSGKMNGELTSYLEKNADQSQKPILEFPNKRTQDYGEKPKSFWIINLIHLQNVTKDLIEDLATMPEVKQIRLEGYATTDKKPSI